jgi:hypothetical protein
MILRRAGERRCERCAKDGRQSHLRAVLSDKQLRYAVERCFEIAGGALSQLNKMDPDTQIGSQTGRQSLVFAMS